MQHLFFHHAVIKNDDDLIIDGWPDPVTIDLSKVFTNGTPKEVDSMTIQTDERGLVTSIKTKDEMVSFKYIHTKTRAIVVPHVLNESRTNGKATVYYIMYLNKNGFVIRWRDRCKRKIQRKIHGGSLITIMTN